MWGVSGPLRLGLAALLAALALLLGVPAAADATTFCVPGFFSGCPNNGTNVAQANLETAMQTNGSDGTADTVKIQPGFTYTDANSLQAAGTDGLTIDGGSKATTITSSSTGNIYLVDLASGSSRATVMKNLTLEVPASFPDVGGNGAAMQMADDTLDNVDLVSKNPGTRGISSIVGGGTFKHVTVSGAAGGYFYEGMSGSVSTTGTVTVQDVSIDGVVTGIQGGDGGATWNVSGARIRTDATLGQVGIALAKGTVNVTNSLIETPKGTPLSAFANTTGNAVIDAEGMTLVDSNPGNTAPVGAGAISTGSASVTMVGSIARGYQSAYVRSATGAGQANVTIRRSNTTLTGASDSGPGAATLTNNFDKDPLFVNVAARDFRLGTGSPSIDAGDPASTLTTDILGGPRPLDGDGSGTKVADQGAYEHATADTTPPNTTIDSGPASGTTLSVKQATFGFHGVPAADAAQLQCKLDAGAFVPCSSPKTFAALADGAHTVRFRAVDAVGNADPTPAMRSFAVDTTPPQTTIDSGPGKKAKKGKLSFAFSASESATFECSLTKKGEPPAFAGCSSPQKRKLKRKRKATTYVFAVRATDLSGHLDATPATAKFKVAKKRPKRR